MPDISKAWTRSSYVSPGQGPRNGNASETPHTVHNPFAAAKPDTSFWRAQAISEEAKRMQNNKALLERIAP